MEKLMNFKSGLVALVLAVAIITGLSAFNQPEKERSTYFYRYKLTTYTEAQIQNPANYERATNSCATGVHICGVLLDTDNGPSSQPDGDEFDQVKAELWASEQADSPTLAEIKMKN